jgi:hypothetical protein
MVSLVTLQEPNLRVGSGSPRRLRLKGLPIFAVGVFLFCSAGLGFIDLFTLCESSISVDLGALMLSLIGFLLIALGVFVVAKRSWLADKALGFGAPDRT